MTLRLRLRFWEAHPDDRAAAERAQHHLEDTKARWPRVQQTAARMQHQRQLNGWTETVKTIFGGQ